MVRASCSLGSAEIDDSHEATLDKVMLPLEDFGEERFKAAMSVDSIVNGAFSSFITGSAEGLDVEEPIIYVCETKTCRLGYLYIVYVLGKVPQATRSNL